MARSKSASSVKARPVFRASAAVILLRGRGDDLHVYWVKRSDVVPYMPGFHAFAGGSVNADDAVLAQSFGASDANTASEHAPGTGSSEDFEPEAMPVLIACAMRETFEETGIWLGDASAIDADQLDALRTSVLAGELPFSLAASQTGLTLDPNLVQYAGRWSTPPFASARFDTAFFVANVPDGQEPTIRTGELESGEWIRPNEALTSWYAGEAAFAAPILQCLLELTAVAERGDDPMNPVTIERLRTAPQRSQSPVRRIEIKWGIVLHPMHTEPLPPATHTNAYLVGDRDVAIIDPGSNEYEELESLFELIDSLDVDGRRPTCVIATHGHKDHIAGIEAVRGRYGIPVCSHSSIAEIVRADRTLEDGEMIPLESATGDWTLGAILTPGHARGHLCLWHADSHSLFTGDHIIGGQGTVIIDPPEGDMAAYIASLERLLALPIETLFPGHGSPQGAAHTRIRALINHRLQREAKVVAALDGTSRPIADLVERAYADTPRELWPYAERSLLAHLIKLERDQRAELDGDRWRAR